jgi:hypothetical protein
MSIWSATPIDQTPEIELRDWQIYEVSSDEEMTNATRHFVGYNITEGEGRASSSIQFFDPVRRIGITRSGRVYKLVGEPGHNSDANYVWSRWMLINKITGVNVITDHVINDKSSL